MIEVLTSHAFAAWFDTLPEASVERVSRAVSLLESVGGSLGAPHARPLAATWPALETRLACALRELEVADASLRLLYTLEEGGARAVLLYGYDIATDVPGGGRLPMAAHAVLASTAYRDYRSQRSKAG
jgi:hypothetical protein